MSETRRIRLTGKHSNSSGENTAEEHIDAFSDAIVGANTCALHTLSREKDKYVLSNNIGATVVEAVVITVNSEGPVLTVTPTGIIGVPISTSVGRGTGCSIELLTIIMDGEGMAPIF